MSRIEEVQFTFVTAPSVRGDALWDAVQREGRIRAAKAGATRWEADPIGAIDRTSADREQIVRLTLYFEA